jgi:glycine cleavage system aminomethyltransferase T
MSELAFLSPRLAAEQHGVRPVARSPLDRRQRDAGATFEERNGWLVPVSLPGEHEHLAAVGIADLSHLAKYEVRPAGEPLQGDGIVWYAISPRRALAVCAPGVADDLRSRLEGRRVIDVTGALGILAIGGPRATTLLRRLTHLHHLPAGGDVAHVTAHVLEAGGGYWILFPQELGHYLWEVAVDRALPLGGGPVGVDALGGQA